MIAASKQRGTFGDERQHSGTQVAVQSKGHLCGAESNLVKEDRDSSLAFRVCFFLQVQLCVEAYCVQRGSSSHVREKPNLQDMEQEILIINTVHSVQEKDHGSLVIWHKTS